MSYYADISPAGRIGPLPYEFADWRESRYRAPLPVKIVAVVAAFWLFHPLGVALLLYFVWRAARRNGGCAFRPGAPSRRWGEAASSRNAAFEERRRETLKRLDEEAEAFDAFARGRREARDREDFERFMDGRNARKSGDRPK